MNKIQYIKQLPELEDHQEWSCISGCDHIVPKLYRDIYSESWDNNGIKMNEMAENYYTCQGNHILAVWDNDANDYVVLPDQAYQVRENRLKLSIDQIENIRNKLAIEVAKFINTSEFFSNCRASYELTLKDGSTIMITPEYLNEIEAVLKSNMILGAE